MLLFSQINLRLLTGTLAYIISFTDLLVLVLKYYLLTVGTYSLGNLFVVYEINRHVLPTAPSPTTTHLMVCILIYK